MQDWLPIRPIDPRHHVKAFICALRSIGGTEDAEVAVEPTLLQRGVERC